MVALVLFVLAAERQLTLARFEEPFHYLQSLQQSLYSHIYQVHLSLMFVSVDLDLIQPQVTDWHLIFFASLHQLACSSCSHDL